MISSSKVIKLPGGIKQINAISDRVNKYLQDEELKKIIDQKIERIQKKSYEDGYSKGIEQGKQEGHQQYDNAIQMFQTVFNAMNTYIDSLHKEMEQEIVALTFALSEKVIRRQLSSVQEMTQIICDAMHKIPEKRGIVITLHPSAENFIDTIKGELKTHNIPLEQIEIELDSSVGQGGCCIETDTSVIDGRIESIVSEVENRLQELAQWEPNN